MLLVLSYLVYLKPECMCNYINNFSRVEVDTPNVSSYLPVGVYVRSGMGLGILELFNTLTLRIFAILILKH